MRVARILGQISNVRFPQFLLSILPHMTCEDVTLQGHICDPPRFIPFLEIGFTDVGAPIKRFQELTFPEFGGKGER
jgi:hypothetical protein